MSERRVEVVHAGGAYAVRIGPGLLRELPGRIRALAPRARKVFTVQDRGAPAGPILEAGARLMVDYKQQIVLFDPSEANKSLEWHAELQRRLAADGTQRTDVVVAYGGGITGDLAGYAAATYRRGMGLIQCPTTLLSMVDASVGGKTGVNLDVPGAGLLKNLVGAFYQPLEVIADTDTLSTLDERTFRSGLGECVKHGLIAGEWEDPGLFEWTTACTPAILARDGDALGELIARNVSVKARVVHADERETSTTRSGRQLLNLGHTFAHAIEPLDGLGPNGTRLTHGEAVGLGLIAASACSAALGRVPADHTARVRDLLSTFGLPTRVSGELDAAHVVARMHHDKKATGGTLRMVLPTGDATCEVVDAPDDRTLKRAIESISNAQ